MIERLHFKKYYDIFQLLLTINISLLPAFTALVQPSIAHAKSEQGAVITLTEDELIALQGNIPNIQQNFPDLAAEPTPQSIPSTLPEAQDTQVDQNQITAEQLAEMLGIPVRNFTLLEPSQVKVETNYFATEEAYKADLAQLQAAFANTTRVIGVVQADGTIVNQPLPPRAASEMSKRQVAGAECTVEAGIDDGLMAGSSTHFVEKAEAFAPSGATIFEAQVTNTNPAPKVAQLQSVEFASAETKMSQRIIVVYTRSQNIQPGSVATLSVQIVHADGHRSGYGLTAIPPTQAINSWSRQVYILYLRPQAGENRTDKVSYAVAFPQGDNITQVVDADAIYTFACPNGNYLPIISSAETAPPAIEAYVQKHWLAFKKRVSTQSDQDFKAEVARKYGVTVLDPGAISNVINNWLAVNPNTTYYYTTLPDGRALTIDFVSAEAKHTGLITTEGDAQGTSLITFIPFVGPSSGGMLPEYIAQATMEAAGQKIGGFIINTGAYILRIGSIAGAFTLFIFNNMYTTPFQMWDSLAPTTLILHRLGTRYGAASIVAGSKPLAEIPNLIAGTLPTATFIAKRSLRFYVPEAKALEIETQAWYTVAKEWLILPQSILTTNNIPSLPETNTANILADDITKTGTLEELLASQFTFAPTIVPPQYSNHLAFVQTEQAKLIQTLSDAFTTTGVDVHSSLTQAAFQANQKILDTFRTAPTVQTYDSQLDTFSSAQQLLHLSAMAEEGIKILRSNMSADPEQTKKTNEQITVLLGHVILLQNKIFSQKNGSGTIGISTVTNELQTYKQEYQRLLTAPLSPGEKVSLAYFQDDVTADGQFGFKRGEAYFTTLTLSIKNTVDALLDPSVKRINLTAAPTLNAQNQLTFKPVLAELPSGPEAVHTLTADQAMDALTALSRQIGALTQKYTEINKLADAASSSPFVGASTKKTLTDELNLSRDTVTSELTALKEIKKKLQDKLFGAATAFVIAQYTANFTQFFGANTTSRLSSGVADLTADIFRKAELQSASTTFSYAQLQDVLNVYFAAWFNFLQNNQVPAPSIMAKYGSDFYTRPDLLGTTAPAFLGTFWRFEPAIGGNTAGLFITDTNFKKHKAAGAVTNADVLGLIKLSNDVTIYMLNATKTSLTSLDGVLGIGPANNNTGVSLSAFIETVREKGKQIGTAPTEPQIDELEGNDKLLQEMLEDIDFTPLDRDPGSSNDPKPPNPPLPPNWDFQDIDLREGCYEPLSQEEALELVIQYYQNTNEFGTPFEGKTSQEIRAIIMEFGVTEDVYNTPLNERKAESISLGKMIVYLDGTPDDPEEFLVLAAIDAFCNDRTEAGEPYHTDQWDYEVFTSRWEIVNSGSGTPAQNIEDYMQAVYNNYQFDYSGERFITGE